MRHVNFHLAVNASLYGIHRPFCSLAEGITIAVAAREVPDGLVDIRFGIALGGAVTHYPINALCFQFRNSKVTDQSGFFGKHNFSVVVPVIWSRLRKLMVTTVHPFFLFNLAVTVDVTYAAQVIIVEVDKSLRCDVIAINVNSLPFTVLMWKYAPATGCIPGVGRQAGMLYQKWFIEKSRSTTVLFPDNLKACKTSRHQVGDFDHPIGSRKAAILYLFFLLSQDNGIGCVLLLILNLYADFAILVSTCRFLCGRDSHNNRLLTVSGRRNECRAHHSPLPRSNLN